VSLVWSGNCANESCLAPFHRVENGPSAAALTFLGVGWSAEQLPARESEAIDRHRWRGEREQTQLARTAIGAPRRALSAVGVVRSPQGRAAAGDEM